MDFATYQKLIEHNKHRTDENIIARFYDKSVKTGQTDTNGIPLFKLVCYCEIRIKDNTTEIFNQPATQDKIERFPVEYARYQLSKKQTEAGTPLEMFAFLDAGEIDTCKYRGIFTVEALAGLSDEHAKDINLSAESILARRFIANSKQMKNVSDFSQKEAEYKAQIAELKSQIFRLSQSGRRRR